ncbi:protein kinase [bacterium]|nr:protein kinase [bacterium]
MENFDPYLGKTLGSFHVDSKLGSGAMGVVYQATHTPSGKKFALKLLPREMSLQGQTAVRFRREANLLQQFKHPNIVRFLAFGKHQGDMYVAMEMVTGGTLDALLDKEAPLDWREAARLAIEICDALQYAHEREVVHRDLKPSNLLLTPDRHIKLSDFGIAKDLMGTDLTATGRTLGTAAYMAPEQISIASSISHKTDLYALGVILHQMLSSKLPFDATTQPAMLAAHLNNPPPRPSSKNPEIPLVLDDLVYSLLQKAPSERPWDALAVATQLRDLLDSDAAGKPIKYVVKPGLNPTRAGADDLARRASKGKNKPKSARNYGKMAEVAGLVAVLGLILGGVGYWLWPPSEEYLFARATQMMQSGEYTDWTAAMSRYIGPLERRFPDNPHQSEIRQWKDKILAERVNRRAEVLDKSTIATLGRPDNPAEDAYIKARDAAADDIRAGRLTHIAGHWQKLAETLAPMAEKDDIARGWLLLTQERLRQVREAWEADTRPVLEKHRRWMQAHRFGSPKDLEETTQEFQDALKNSKVWSATMPDQFPLDPKFEPVEPPAGN